MTVTPETYLVSKFNVDDWRCIEACLQRCRDEAKRQVEKGHLEGCSGFAWYATRAMLSHIERLLPGIGKKIDG
jgi:hypothetical protein